MATTAPSQIIRNEMTYLAADTADVIRDIKSASWKVLAGYTASFAFMLSVPHPQTMALSLLMVMGGMFAAYLTFYFYPIRLRRRRELLRRVHKNYFSTEFKKTHGNVDHIPGEDIGDLLHRDLGTLYILVLLAIFVLVDPALVALFG
jgi:hypothetical protein